MTLRALSRWPGLVALAIPCLASTAWAQDSPAPSAPAESEYYYTEYQRSWYGWQTLALDAPLLTGFYIATRAEKNALSVGLLSGFVVGAPIVHWSHGKTVEGIVSMSTHLMLPVAGFLLGRIAVSEIDPSSKSSTRTATSVALGGIAAAAFDVIYLGWEEKAVRRDIEARPMQWRPSLVVDGSSAMLVLQLNGL